MDKLLNTTFTKHKTGTLVGGDILDLITYSQYTDPFSIYREYLQNAADSIAVSTQADSGVVDITLLPAEKRISIRDNGSGLSYEQARNELIPIAKSTKWGKGFRGFRGIGRLSGLAFGNAVTFLTRSQGSLPVTKIVWDGIQLRYGIQNKLSLKETILRSVIIETVDGEDYPEHFFEVQISGIARFAAGKILNRDAVREYIGEVCPVPFKQNFPYSLRASLLGQDIQRSFTLNAYISGEEKSITRLHGEKLHLSGGKMDEYTEFEEIKVPSLKDGDLAAVGWVVHSSYSGAIPKESGVRSIRARVGNIQIGDETVFDHLFSESRFNRWCVAEFHIFDQNIVPNGRRDYFEPNPHLRNLENHLSILCRKIEKNCRNASKLRNQKKRIVSSLKNMSEIYYLANSGYLTPSVSKQLISEKLSEILHLRKNFQFVSQDNDLQELTKMEVKLRKFGVCEEQNAFDGMNVFQISIYRDIFSVLAKIAPTPEFARETIETILSSSKRFNK